MVSKRRRKETWSESEPGIDDAGAGLPSGVGQVTALEDEQQLTCVWLVCLRERVYACLDFFGLALCYNLIRMKQGVEMNRQSQKRKDKYGRVYVCGDVKKPSSRLGNDEGQMC